jgi:hypothetical protein
VSAPRIRPSLYYGVSVALALIAVLFYIAPAQHYQQFLSKMMSSTLETVWVCRHMLLEDVMQRPWAVLGFSLTLLCFFTFGIFSIYRRARITDMMARREAYAMMACGIVAFFMLMPVSAPIWDLWRATGAPGMPWRMQYGVGLALIALIAIYTQWLENKSKQKTLSGDVGISVMFLIFLSFGYGTNITKESKLVMERLIAAKIIVFDEHFSKWTNEAHHVPEAITELHEKHPNRPLASLPRADGVVITANKKAGGLVIDVQLNKPSALHIEQFYFPIWRATDDKGNTLKIEPIDGSGRMSVQLDKGHHRIQLTREIYSGTWLLSWCRQLSAAAWIFMLIWLCHSRKKLFLMTKKH